MKWVNPIQKMQANTCIDSYLRRHDIHVIKCRHFEYFENCFQTKAPNRDVHPIVQ